MGEPNLIPGYWWFPEAIYAWDPHRRPDWEPTGALWLRRGQGTLDGAVVLTCCMLDGTWCPISERGVPAYTHTHTSLIARGGFVAFIVATDPWQGQGRPTTLTFQAVGAAYLQPGQVKHLYGEAARERARSDTRTAQIRLLPLQKPLSQMYDEDQKE